MIFTKVPPLLPLSSAPPVDPKEEQQKFWPGFTVQCNKCGGFHIMLENTMGYSDTSGTWGSIDMICQCGNQTELAYA